MKGAIKSFGLRTCDCYIRKYTPSYVKKKKVEWFFKPLLFGDSLGFVFVDSTNGPFYVFLTTNGPFCVC